MDSAVPIGRSKSLEETRSLTYSLAIHVLPYPSIRPIIQGEVDDPYTESLLHLLVLIESHPNVRELAVTES